MTRYFVLPYNYPMGVRVRYEDDRGLFARIRGRMSLNSDVQGTLGSLLDRLSGSAISNYRQGRWHVRQTMRPDATRGEIDHHKRHARARASELPIVGQRAARSFDRSR